MEYVIERNYTAINFVNKADTDVELINFANLSRIKIKNYLLKNNILPNVSQADIKNAVLKYNVPISDIFNLGIKVNRSFLPKESSMYPEIVKESLEDSIPPHL
jgi:hypothetical protein